MKLLILTGSSTSGKNTLADLLLKDRGFAQIMTATSRARRPGEAIDAYYFLDESAFRKKSDFFEMENNHGNYYGLLKSELNEKLKSVKKLIWVLDPKGAYKLMTKLRKFLPKDTISVYLTPGRKVLVERIKNQRKEKNLKARLKSIDEEFNILSKGKFDFIVSTNCEISESLANLKKIIGV
ncbi:MAG TPA: hypothetical protein VJC07_05510 [Candidatus Nanoarchaeia archaeon]|nr:hypothetical protein [Candidatus Nanoarchaeia archaeon]